MATVLTNLGRQGTIQKMNNNASYPIPSYVAHGTGTGTSAVTDTALFTEADTRANGTVSIVTTTVTNDTFQVIGTMTAGAAETIRNAGLFDASTAGNLYVHGDFTGVTLNAGDQIVYTIKIQHS
jgi:hypothetical protein